MLFTYDCVCLRDPGQSGLSIMGTWRNQLAWTAGFTAHVAVKKHARQIEPRQARRRHSKVHQSGSAADRSPDSVRDVRTVCDSLK
jgi:hypothetical protein